jgi:hypothetical protein
LNTTARSVIVQHDVNALLVANRASPLVVPFAN